MALDREALIAALFSRLKERIPEVAFWSRRFTGWENLPEKPAGVLEKVTEQAESMKGLPTKWTITLDLSIFYELSDDPEEAQDLQPNIWLQRVEAALERTASETNLAEARFSDDAFDPRTTLGGMCAHCWINGTVDTDSGALGRVGLIIVPIEILATA